MWGGGVRRDSQGSTQDLEWMFPDLTHPALPLCPHHIQSRALSYFHIWQGHPSGDVQFSNVWMLVSRRRVLCGCVSSETWVFQGRSSELSTRKPGRLDLAVEMVQSWTKMKSTEGPRVA